MDAQPEAASIGLVIPSEARDPLRMRSRRAAQDDSPREEILSVPLHPTKLTTDEGRQSSHAEDPRILQWDAGDRLTERVTLEVTRIHLHSRQLRHAEDCFMSQRPRRQRRQSR